jgi:hypothetical protein
MRLVKQVITFVELLQIIGRSYIINAVKLYKAPVEIFALESWHNFKKQSMNGNATLDLFRSFNSLLTIDYSSPTTSNRFDQSTK